MANDKMQNVQPEISDEEAMKYVRKLRRKKTGFFYVPEELRLHPLIIKAERKFGVRESGRRGFDIIRNTFFVEETVLDIDTSEGYHERTELIYTFFPDFYSYYEFVAGDVYDNACYFGYAFSPTEIENCKIDLDKINFMSFTDETIRNYSVRMSREELTQYQAVEKEKVLRKKWISKFNTCNTYEEFKKVVDNFEKSKLYKDSTGLGFFFNIFIHTETEKAFEFLRKWHESNSVLPSDYIQGVLCSVYGPQKVLDAYYGKIKSKDRFYKRKKRLKELVDQMENGAVKFVKKNYFDEKTHYFCSKVDGFSNEGYYTPLCYIRYFETFQEFAEYLENDLSGCDLSKALLPDVDFSVYKTDDYTKLPVQNPNDLKYSIYKGYDSNQDCFIVDQSWAGGNGQIIRRHTNGFRYFFDYLFFLENDLSDADLLMCDGMKYFQCFQNVNFTNARLRSNVLDMIKVPYKLEILDMAVVESFLPIMRNEDESAIVLAKKREEEDDSIRDAKIYYISDLHLMHKLKDASWKTENDICYIVQMMINKMLKTIEYGDWFLLIGGDISSDFKVFALFVRQLRRTLNEQDLSIDVIFLLGNHELWGFSGFPFTEIVSKYRTVVEEQGMYLLQNEILYRENGGDIRKITAQELKTEPREWLREQLRRARVILFGGLAFSGNNEKHNADYGLYRGIISREEEIAESKEFKRLYDIVCNAVPDRKVVVFTHTPREDWDSNDTQHPEYVYVSGHTHRNYFYDDGVYRTYADNQVGYKNKNPGLKSFYVDNTYDVFQDYEDGIYKITSQQYRDFYRGKNRLMTFKRKLNPLYDCLYMLKKNGYYCFIYESEYGSLSILNGGAMKGLYHDNIEYYYNNMDAVIAKIRAPLDKYTSLQKRIAHEVQVIGGKGYIHGAIIDIDFFNHIYVNPFDLTVTGYEADDIICKKVFPSIPCLLEANCPELYSAYLKNLKGEGEFTIAVRNEYEKKNHARSCIYLEDDIYRASKEIKKMQRLDYGVLTTWPEFGYRMIE